MQNLEKFLEENCPNITPKTWLRWVEYYTADDYAAMLALGEAAFYNASEEFRVGARERMYAMTHEMDPEYIKGVVYGILFTFSNSIVRDSEAAVPIILAAYTIDELYFGEPVEQD